MRPLGLTDAALRKRHLALTNRWKKENPDRHRALNLRWYHSVKRLMKFECLSHYGKGKKLLCKAKGCRISDIDILTLDHILDGGAKERKKGLQGGPMAYYRLKRLGWPTGFQTLCMNHQWKKEMLRRRRNAGKDYSRILGSKLVKSRHKER